MKDNDGAFIYDDETKAKLLYKFYSSVFINDNNNFPSFDKRVDGDCSLSHGNFSLDVVFRHLTKQKTQT